MIQYGRPAQLVRSDVTHGTCQPDSTCCIRLGNHQDHFSFPLKFSNFSHKFSFPCLNKYLSLSLSSLFPKPYVIKNCSSSSTDWAQDLGCREEQERDSQFNNETLISSTKAHRRYSDRFHTFSNYGMLISSSFSLVFSRQPNSFVA